MRHRHIMAVYRVAVPAGRHVQGQMRDDLMAEEIEVDPFFRAPPLRAAEQPAIEGARGGEIVDGKGEVEGRQGHGRSEEHTSELQSLMRKSYAVFCLKKKRKERHR